MSVMRQPMPVRTRSSVICVGLPWFSKLTRPTALGPSAFTDDGELVDVPVLRIDEGIAVEPGHLAAPLGLAHVGLDGAREVGGEVAVDLPERLAFEFVIGIGRVDAAQEGSPASASPFGP